MLCHVWVLDGVPLLPPVPPGFSRLRGLMKPRVNGVIQAEWSGSSFPNTRAV